MVNVYIKERINDQITMCAGGVTGNTTYLGCGCGVRGAWGDLCRSTLFYC